jgi:L-fucose dehydrogenase
LNLHLKNKTVIVTGGSKGIGEGITRALVEEEANVLIASRSKSANERITQELSDKGANIDFITVELDSAVKCKSIVEQTVQRFGSIYGIVNNAGVNDGIGLEKGSPGEFRDSVAKNLYHYYDLVHYALPHLIESKGSVVNISSKVAVTGQGNTSGYAASKGAQLALTREWAAELLPHGVRVNAILPAEVMTPLYEKWLNTFEDPDSKLKSITKNIPLEKRMTTKEEIAAMAVFLLSDRSSHTTGQFLYVDGGYVHLDRSIK